MSKSRPTYAPLRPDPTGRRHLLLLDDGALSDGGELRARLRDWPPVEVWSVEPTLSKVELTDRRIFASRDGMFQALEQRLLTETMGLRLYAEGEEAFVWDVFGRARAAGMGRSEVSLHRRGRLVRRVYCVHCGAISQAVETDVVRCEICGAYLAVRDHFSPRLAAFIGVQADAETPGELPSAAAFRS